MERYSARIERGEQLIAEMQSGGGRGDRAFVLGENGLVVVAVPLVVLASRRDIGRQRHVTERLDRLLKHGAVKIEAQKNFSALADFFHRRIERAEQAHAALMTETNAIARLQPFC